VTTRSWLFETLNLIDSAKYDSTCNASPNPYCALEETTPLANASSSAWAWPAAGNCNYSTKICTILGLKGSADGLITSNDAAAAGLQTTLGNADYSAFPTGAGNDALTLALTAYETW